MFYMFVQADRQQPTSSSRMKEEAAEESQQSATDDNDPEVLRPPLYTQWNPDTGMTEVRRGYRPPIPEGRYVTRTWTEAPPEPHVIRYEGIKHGYRGLVTRVHNLRTGFFEVKRSPLQSPAVSPVHGTTLHGMHGTTRDIKLFKLSLSISRTDHKLKQSTNTETPHTFSRINVSGNVLGR